jgi:hypothetical protein
MEQTLRDIGDKCTRCNRDTSFGSGLFVNRIPSTTDEVTGYMCPECQMSKCDDCDKKFLELETLYDGEVRVCTDCLDARNKIGE